MPVGIQKVLFGQTGLPRLERALDVSAARQRVLTENVANAETPGYERKDIDFAGALKSALEHQGTSGLRTTRPGHLSGSQSQVYHAGSDSRGEGKVELDQEMAHLAENQLQYGIAARLAAKNFAALRLAIRGSR